MRDMIDNFINHLKVESVKLQLQLSSPAKDVQKNDVLGNITDGDLDAAAAMTVVREAMADLRSAETVMELQELYDKWNKNRIEIQYEGYGYYERPTRKGEAHAYVFLMRVLKKHHKELFKYMKMAPQG